MDAGICQLLLTNSSEHHRVHTSPSSQLPDSIRPQSHTSQSPHYPQVQILKSRRSRSPQVPRSQTSLSPHVPNFTSSPSPHVPESTRPRVNTFLSPHRSLVHIVTKSTRFRVPHPTSCGGRPRFSFSRDLKQ